MWFRADQAPPTAGQQLILREVPVRTTAGILHGCCSCEFRAVDLKIEVDALVKGEQMADEDVQAELARLRAENESLKQKRSSAVSMKVSEKGAVSVYGLGRFPVTLYQEQWQKLLALADDIKTFIEENRSKLKVKE
jgi:hypothetical protein